jgi:hypothetical protein
LSTSAQREATFLATLIGVLSYFPVARRSVMTSCLGVVHPERGLELIGEGRRKSFANPRIRTIQAGS